MSLSDFHSTVATTTTPSSNQNSSTQPGMSWADEMNLLEDSTKPSQENLAEIRAQLPTAPKAALAPDFNLDQVPKQPPFTAHLSNVSFEADESKIRAFFLDSKILNVRLPTDERGRFRGFGQVDFENRESLINALAKHETKFFNRPIKVQLESGHKPKTQGGGYGAYQQRGGAGEGGSGHTGQGADEDTDWRARPAQEPEPEPAALPPKSYSFHSRGQLGNQQQQPQQGNNGGSRYQQQDRQQMGTGQQRRGPWQSRDEQQSGGGGSGQQTQQRRPWQNRDEQQQSTGGGSRDQYQQRTGGGSSGSSYNQNRPPRQYDNRGSGEHQPLERSPSGTNQAEPTSPPQTQEVRERPKIMLQPRTIPVESDAGPVPHATNIFGAAKPVNTAAKEREIEERLAREREALAAEKERERLAKEQQDQEQQQQHEGEKQQKQQTEGENQNDSHDNVTEAAASVQHPPAHRERQERVHRASHTSDDSRHHKSNENEFQTVGAKRHNKNDTNNNSIRGGPGSSSGGQRLAQSSSFTSPPHARPAPSGSGNAWKAAGSKPAAELFTANSESSSGAAAQPDSHHTQQRSYNQGSGGSRQFVNSKYASGGGGRPGGNREGGPSTGGNNRDRPRGGGFGGGGRGGPSGGGGGAPARGTGQGREMTRREPGSFATGTNPAVYAPQREEAKELASEKMANKFAFLKVDVEDDEEDLEHEEEECEEEEPTAAAN